MTPILYSFRRCPYAMRARLAIHRAGVAVELREVKLRAKPQAFLDASPSGTVPCLVTAEGVIDESLDIMIWALRQNDPDAWLDQPPQAADWITRMDGPFKRALDRTKYPNRFDGSDPATARATAHGILAELDAALAQWGARKPGLLDAAILPFVRQFAQVDRADFDAQPWPNLHPWLDRFLTGAPFGAIMDRPAPWQPGDAPLIFPPNPAVA